MVKKIRTLDFLPEVFKTETNSQFLNATLDVLTSQPNLKRVQGFIGEKYGYSIEPQDRYVVEPTKVRSDYQLDPSVVFLKPGTQTAQDFIDYPAIVQAIKNQGGITQRNDRLFESQFYSWDPFVDLDKLVNYSQYYWLPLGPDAVPITVNPVFLNQDYLIIQSDNGYQFQDVDGTNPTLTLLRGGTYTFVVEGTEPFWIQGVPGITGIAPDSNTDTRAVLGVTNNGATTGTVTFTVPAQNAQQQYTSLPGNNTVDLVTTAAFADINGQTASSIGNIDGITDLNGRNLIFYDNGDPSTQGNYYNISVDSITDIITLTAGSAINTNEKITVISGLEYSGQSFFLNVSGVIEIVPYISSVLDTLYYQNGNDALSVGRIRIVDSNAANSIEVDEIIGRSTYTSPNGIKFTNGLKVEFQGNVVPASYQNQQYYVEGVGSSINLLPVENFISPELPGAGIYQPWSLDPWDSNVFDILLYVSLDPEYITISRNSFDYNAWSRANRWFHQDVINTTQAALGYVSNIEQNKPTRASRPIVEFRGNLKLFNSGTEFIGFIDFAAGPEITDAFSQIVGQTPASVPLVDGQQLREGDTVIFPYDTDPAVRNTVYYVTYVPENSSTVIALNPRTVALGNQQVTVLSGVQYSGTTWWFNDVTTLWTIGQKKTQLNQPPLYNIYNQSEVSLSNNEYYSSTNFTGCKLFSYTTGTGQDDPVLGFPIVLTNPSTLGDISFTVNLNSDTFTFSNSSGDSITENVNTGFVYEYTSRTLYTRKTGWVPAAGPSYQYQVFEFPVTATTQTSFVCDVPASTTTPWNQVQVYYNDNLLTQNQFASVINTTDNTTTVTLSFDAVQGDKITVLVISDVASKTAYYEIPSNLENNPFNTNIQTVSVGDLRNQYRSIYSNLRSAVGPLFGDNNYHDLGNVNRYGTAIIQNSSSLVLPGVFLRKAEADIFSALQFNSEQYTIYKQVLIDLAREGDYSIYQTTNEILDNVLYQITKARDGSTAFFWSDMIPSGSPYASNTYTFSATTTNATFSLSQSYDFSQANYNGVLVYVNSVETGRNISTLLIRGQDYTVEGSNLTVAYTIQEGETVTVNEYNQTYGSYCPNTPSKLGMYPAYVPAVVLDTSYTNPTYFIQGHDGSYTKLYGNYDPITGQLDDFRDSVLLEFEKRIYNNIKVSGEIPLQYDQVAPGEFRTTQYSWNEILNIYSTNFLNWVGANRIDFKTQQYNALNQFSYNYNQSSDKLTNTALKQGYWRGIYRWFYDCDNPAQFPWQMLGLVNEPDWWTDRYGAAPYTNDNTFMWQEIAQGYVWNNGDSYVVPDRVRPELLSCLPVNGAGELVSPIYSVVGLYSNRTFQKDWRVGDGSPAESAYLKSSTWPFDLMRLLAVTKPAKFFNLFADLDLYKYDAEFDQYLYNHRYHLDPRTLQVYGSGTSKNSYINWVVDYINQRGSDGYTVMSSLLSNLDVRLTYNLAGFSAKEYLKFLIETATPNSRNTNLLIPDESYQVLLYNNVPEEKVTYSSVIVQKTSKGWTVYGNSQNRQYFTIVDPKFTAFENLSAGSVTVQVSKDYYSDRTSIVPYGTLFYSLQAVCEFIINYGRYLTQQGVIFENIIDGVVYTWDRMAQEFLLWGQQDWEIGSVVNLNPNAKTFIVDRPGLVVQPLTIQQRNFILNQNLLPLQAQDSAIIRDNTAFKVRILSEGDTIAYSNLELSSIEHAVVFDNYTVFNDTIYNLTTGLRQLRLLMQGYKTGDWQGYVDTSGFILNEDNVQEWQPNVKYPKGIIVTYKGFYWTAIRLIEPTDEFSNQDWLKTEYDQIKTGLLPNPSTNAYESLYYYDTNRANLEQDADLLSYSLIGFRPRQYLADADLSDTTQVNVYKNIVKEKGTNLIANAFRSAELVQGRIDYNIQENWALKNGDFGAVLNSNFVEFILKQDQLKGNPTLVGFNTGTDVADVQQNVNINELTNWERPPTSANFLPAYLDGYSIERGIPTAGYVNLGDSKYQEFVYSDLNATGTNIENLYRNDIIWVANHQSKWNVYAAVSMNNQVQTVTNLLNNTAQVAFSQPHGLSRNDLIAIVNFDDRVNGFYAVQSVQNDNTIVISVLLDASVNVIEGQGAAFRMVARRFDQPSDAANNLLPNSAWTTNKIWADADTDLEWAVYASSPVFRESPVLTDSVVNNSGLSVAYNSSVGVVSVDGQGTLYVNGNPSAVPGGFGARSKVLIAGSAMYVSSPETNTVSSYSISSSGTFSALAAPITVSSPDNIAVSNDNLWLYVSNLSANLISVYALNLSTNSYNLVNTISAPVNSTAWGMALATSVDGVKLVVGAPYENTNGVFQSGAAYVYTRQLQRFYADGFTSTFTLSNAAPGAVAFIYINDVLQTTGYTFNGTVLQFSTPPGDGSIVSVSAGGMTLIEKFQSANPHQGGLFGVSVDTNRYGAQIVVGCPFELGTVDDSPNVEGAVYRLTNAGQLYGSVQCQVSGSQTGTIAIDGYVVNFSGNAAAIVSQINVQTPTNILAELSSIDTNKFTITVRPGTPETLYNIIDVTGTQTDLQKLGIDSYTQTQIIYNPDLTDTSEFGRVVKMNERDSLLISGPTATRQSPTTFDFTNNCIQDDTIFDNDCTLFIDVNDQTGVVYEYDLLPSSNENINNPGQYAFGQYISSGITQPLSQQPRFGTSLAYASGVIVVGAPAYFAGNLGLVDKFDTTWTPSDPCEVVKTTSWYVDKKPLPQVDINAVNNICIYDRLTNETLEWLDYIDPVQGKLLGAIQTNLDYICLADPAGYGNGDVAWSAAYVGHTWLDLNTIKLLNYHQPDVTYNANNWGRAFPGSTADIYTWVESDTEPLEYTGAGFPVVFDRFVQVNSLDDSTNSIKTKYYFWVKYYDQVPPGKTLSPIILSQYILEPLSSGIAYLAPITTNIISLYNSDSYIQAGSSSMHLGFRTARGIDDKHTSWSLIRENNSEDFLSGYNPGLPPKDQYLKFIDSFVGADRAGNPVPDPRLPELVKYGTSFRPRQSMFVDRVAALEIYLTYANNILIQFPIAETKNLSFLNNSGPGYDTADYWQYVDWWAPGFSADTKPVLELANVGDLQTITGNQLLVGSEGLSIALEDGLVVKISSNTSSNSEYYVYNSNTGWTRIGLTNGTIQILPKLWEGPFGWNVSPWDSQGWDNYPMQEIYWIIRWLNEYCYINDLDSQRNTSLILMFKFIQSESLQQQNYLPWLNKTSLIDVNHRVRDLFPYKKFQRDNQEFLAGYLNEIKPYHVYIKDFVFSYDGQDAYLGDVTDFDLPAQYNNTTGQFETPRLVYTDANQPDEYTPDSDVWFNPAYSQWFSNYGLSIANEDHSPSQVTVLADYVTTASTEITVKNSRGLPYTGLIILGEEIISYESIDFVTNTLMGVSRGVNGSVVSAHLPGTAVKCELPGVIVLDQGRGYTEPPRIEAYIDLGIYPAPRIEASLRAVMADGKVIGIEVLNPGSGYAVRPEIYIDSSITSTFGYTAINLVDNTINIPGHEFVTGDSVTFVNLTADTGPAGINNGSYYYVRSIDANNVALYQNYQDAVQNTEVSNSDGRIDFVTTGSGTSYRLAVTARAVCFTTGQPVREFNIAMRFDRVSYRSSITDWESGAYYAGVYATSNSSGPELASSSELTSTGGVIVSVLSAQADYYSNTIINVAFTQAAPAQISGQQFTFYEAGWTNPETYYLKLVNGTQMAVYYDASFNLPVPLADFNTSLTIAYLPEPFYFERSLVMYGGKLWRCLISNNDTDFDITKWEIVTSDDSSLTDADRVMAFYNPTPSMPGRDLRQILTGVEYPDATFKGPRFGLEREPWSSVPFDTLAWDGEVDLERFYDTKLLSPSFTYDPVTNPTYWDVQGGTFAQGYGPEELVPGLLTDNFDLSVTTKPGSTWNPLEVDGWDEAPYSFGPWDPDIYDHTGFNILEFRATPDPVTYEISFAHICQNPVSLSIFAQTLNPTTQEYDQFRVTPTNFDTSVNYTVNWVTKTITVQSAYLRPLTLTVAVYEFGNGSQMVRGNNSAYPLRNIDGHSEIYFDIAANNLTIPSAANDYGSAMVYVNGVRIPYQGQVTGASQYFTVEPQVNSVNSRIVFNTLYNPGTHYVTFVINSGTSGVSVPQTQYITPQSGVYTYDLDFWFGDDNVDNAIVERSGYRLYDLLPNVNVVYKVQNISGYTVPIAQSLIPTFNSSQLSVDVANSTYTPPQYAVNFDSTTLSAAGLDGEWNAAYGLLDVGVDLDTSSLYVVFDPATFTPVPAGTDIVITYSVAGLSNPYTINYNAGLGRWQITFNTSLPMDAIFAVTSFNKTDQQSLETDVFSNVTVTEITSIVSETGYDIYGWAIPGWAGGVYTVTTLNPHNLSDGDHITVDSLDGSTQFSCYVKIINATQFGLFSDYALTIPYSESISYTGSGAFVWKTDSYVLTQPDYNLYNTQRLWVTIDDAVDSTGGVHLGSQILRLYNNVEVFDGTTTQTYKNVMGILREIGITEQVVALSMVPAETPAEQSFRVNVNRAGFSNVYRTNQFTRTYLTETTVSTGRFDDVLHVHDVRKLVQVLEFTETPDGDNFVRVPVNNADQITAIIIVDGLGTVITDYTIDQPVTGGNTNYLNNNNSLGITINEPYYGPVAITVAVGNRVYIQGEYVGFTSVNLVDNTITGLKRGLSGTITNSVFEQYSTVQGMLERDRFPQEWYSVNWYDRYAPLQLNTTEQAWFLRQQLP